MQKLIGLLLVLGISTATLRAQHYEIYKGDTINHKDTKGLKQGLWRKYYRTDTLFSETIFKDDKPVNESRTWYECGKLKAIVTFDKNNSKRANGWSYYESGKLLAKGIYNNQKKDSTWIYYGENDSIKSIEFYKNGVPDKTWKVYYENGKLAEETTFLNGKKAGVHKEYNEDGVLIFEMPYKNDIAEGRASLYYINGKLKESGMYHNGLREGAWTRYEANGNKLRELHYKNGVSKEPETEEEH